MRVLTLLPALLLFIALPAAADAVRCGKYRSADGGMALVFTTASSGYRHNDLSEPEPFWVDRSAAQTRLVMLDDAVAEPIRLSADGQRIEDVVGVYTLRRSRACAVEPSAALGSCRAAGSDCIAQLPSASPGQAQRACSEGVGAGCSTLLRQLRDGVAVAGRDDTGPARFERPPVCREHTPAHDLQACEAWIDDALATAMQRVGERLEREERQARDLPLPAAALERLQQLCLQHRGGRFCTEVAEQQLIALEPARAVQALQVVCDAGRVSACERTAPLRELGADLRLVPAVQVPCGTYRADGGTVERLDFDGRAQARLHEGAIHLRQDGQALVLRRLANGDLLGMDTQTGYQRYRQPPHGKAQCPPPPSAQG